MTTPLTASRKFPLVLPGKRLTAGPLAQVSITNTSPTNPVTGDPGFNVTSNLARADVDAYSWSGRILDIGDASRLPVLWYKQSVKVWNPLLVGTNFTNKVNESTRAGARAGVPIVAPRTVVISSGQVGWQQFVGDAQFVADLDGAGICWYPANSCVDDSEEAGYLSGLPVDAHTTWSTIYDFTFYDPHHPTTPITISQAWTGLMAQYTNPPPFIGGEILFISLLTQQRYLDAHGGVIVDGPLAHDTASLSAKVLDALTNVAPAFFRLGRYNIYFPDPNESDHGETAGFAAFCAAIGAGGTGWGDHLVAPADGTATDAAVAAIKTKVRSFFSL